jgi:D-sedoheptulose 7-phosphate isomerase
VVTTSTFSAEYLQEATTILGQIDPGEIERIADMLVQLRESGGRLFFLGVGGGAGHASHAVNDFRKIAGIETYTPVDNVSELTARTNDEGWETTFVEWLRGSRLSTNDMIFVFSVGGGSPDRGVSMNIVNALDHARAVGAKIVGVVGRDGGHTAAVADACVIVPTVNPATVTAHTEETQAVVWHLLVSHPRVLVHGMKWESIAKPANE